MVDLVLNETGVHYSTAVENFETSIMNLFDKAILATHKVPQPDKIKHLLSPTLQRINLNSIPLLSILVGDAWLVHGIQSDAQVS